MANIGKVRYVLKGSGLPKKPGETVAVDVTHQLVMAANGRYVLEFHVNAAEPKTKGKSKADTGQDDGSDPGEA